MARVIARAPRGSTSGTTNSHRHDSQSTSAPLMNGPRAGTAAVAATNCPTARSRRSPGLAMVTSANPAASSMAAATP